MSLGGRKGRDEVELGIRLGSWEERVLK